MQVQLFYDIIEDRLKLIVSEGTDARGWWITRRVACLLAEALAARLADTVPADTAGSTREWLLAHHREEATNHFPIYSTPVLTVERVHLLTAIRHGRHTDGRHVLVFIGKNDEEQALLYDDESLYAFLELFRQQLVLTEWDLALGRPDMGQDVEVSVDTLQ